MNEILWGFTKSKIMKMLKISAFYLDKQKSFVPNAIFLDNFVSNESCGVQLVLCSGTHHSEFGQTDQKARVF